MAPRVSIGATLSEPRSRFVRRKPQDPITRRDEATAFVESWRPPEWFSRVAVVLVEPTDAVNIGGVVRVMANTGFLQLRLVRPVEFDPWHIGGVAHYTQHIVSAVRVFDSTQAAVADRQFVLGLTGRHTRVERNALGFSDAIATVLAAAQEEQEAAIIFGREDRGLSNEMLDSCHVVTTIPTNPAYPSLNLAQAALLTLYQLFEKSGGLSQEYRPPRRVSPAAPSVLLEDLVADIEHGLEAIEFFHSRSRVSAMRSIRVALYRARLDVREASLLRAVFLELRKFLVRKGLRERVGPVGTAPHDDSQP